MITSLARQLTQQLCDAGVLAPEHSELYEYGFFLILSRIIFGIIAVCIAISSVSFSLRFYSLFRPCTVALTTSACLAVAGKVAQKNR